MENLLAHFNDLSIEQRKALIVLLKRRGIDVSQLPITGVRRDAPLPLSYGQQRLWFLAQLEPDSSAYHIADAVWLNGAVDASALQRSVNKLVTRHESLRTTFRNVGGKALQVVHEQLQVVVAWLDCRAMLSDEAAVKTKLEAIERQPFDLENGPLLRVSVLKLAADRHVLSIALHHIVADEWSLNIVISEFAEIYRAYCEGREPQLPGLAIGYADFAVWQRHWLEAGEMERQLKYWTEKLAGEHAALELPFDKPRPPQPSDHGAKLEFPLPDALSAALRQYSLEQGATLFMGLLALFKMLLYRYSGQHAIRVGVPIANRNRRETEHLVGFFVNTQVLQTELHGGLSFRQVLDRLKDTALGAQAHPDLPFEQLVEALSPERSLNRNPLFQVMYNHQYQQAEIAEALGLLNIAPFARDSHTTQFELILDTFEIGKDGIVLLWTYASDLFDHSTIERMARHFCRLAEAALAAPETALLDLPLLDPQEWTCSSANEAKPCEWLALAEAIRAKAQAHPDAEALVCAGQVLSYADLQSQSQRLAHHLLASGVKAGDVVGLCLPRSADMIVASLAVWQCGAAFLPLDPDYPEERLRYLLADAGVGCLLSHSEGPSIAHTPASIMTLELDRLELYAYPDTPPALVTHPERTAYLIYTSGSTGQPKGVAVSHGALARHCQSMAEVYAMQAGDVCLHFASFSFDAAIEQWAVPLACGAKVVISDQILWSVEQTLAAIESHGITRIDLPPAYLSELARHIQQPEQAPVLTSCTVGGEA
ncbi:condensation domain-containing protein, partial [Methylomonas rivi]